MNPELSRFATRLRERISDGRWSIADLPFAALALKLFTLQFKYNFTYRKICVARNRTPQTIEDWTQIPAVPTSVFKELELTSLAPEERTTIFHSSGTTEHKPSRHFHSAESLAVYEASLWSWFEKSLLSNSKLNTQNPELICLTPPPEAALHSSLVHMFEVVRRRMGKPSISASRRSFFGRVGDGGAWTLDFEAVLAALSENSKFKIQNSKLILGTAFSFVHLLDYLADKNLRLQLPPGTCVMETGGYKNRSRALPKAELHSLIGKLLGVPRENIFCEYGMSEMSSQAYAGASGAFHFPPWARAQIISTETGREVADGETGLIRIFDLANVFSVAAIQTEDLGVRRGDGFELLGRAQLAEPRGCSLMTA